MMSPHSHSRPHRAVGALTALLAALALLVAVGCTREQRAEQDGKEAGQALCDVRDADGEDAARAALADVEEQLDDLAEKYTTFTAEDRADIAENLSDLVEHVLDGNTALAQQDLAVIRRSIDNIAGDVSDTSRAAADGFLQGIDDCVS